MRVTLEQLKAISEEDLVDMWETSEFPFDKAACGNCLTYHVSRPIEPGDCHGELEQEVRKLYRGGGVFGPFLHKHIEELYALRVKYDAIYQAALPHLERAEQG